MAIYWNWNSQAPFHQSSFPMLCSFSKLPLLLPRSKSSAFYYLNRSYIPHKINHRIPSILISKCGQNSLIFLRSFHHLFVAASIIPCLDVGNWLLTGTTFSLLCSFTEALMQSPARSAWSYHFIVSLPPLLKPWVTRTSASNTLVLHALFLFQSLHSCTCFSFCD